MNDTVKILLAVVGAGAGGYVASRYINMGKNKPIAIKVALLIRIGSREFFISSSIRFTALSAPTLSFLDFSFMVNAPIIE